MGSGDAPAILLERNYEPGVSASWSCSFQIHDVPLVFAMCYFIQGVCTLLYCLLHTAADLHMMCLCELHLYSILKS